MLGNTLFTQADEPVCNGAATNYSIDVNGYIRFHGSPGKHYTFSLCANPENTIAFITTNTTIPSVLKCDDDSCGTVDGPAQVDFIPPTAGTYRLYVFHHNCGNIFPEGTFMDLEVTCSPAVPPLNDDPCDAIELAVGAECMPVSADTRAATPTNNIPLPGCTGALYQGGDVWFTAEIPASGLLGIRTEEITICAGAFQFYTSSNCVGPFTALQNTCTLVGNTGPGSEPAIVFDAAAAGLSTGDDVYIRYWERNNNEPGTFTICAYEVVPPEYDEPCGAVALAVNEACTPLIIETGNTSPLATVTAPEVAANCGAPAGNDSWFSVVVPSPLPTNGFNVTVSDGTITDAAMAWYTLESGSICGPGVLNEIACSATGSIQSTDVAGPVVPGTTIYVRVWSEDPWYGTFGICAQITPSPLNDDPCGAFPLAVSFGCVPSQFSNAFATPTGTAPIGTAIVPDPGCGTPDADVWFTAQVPADGMIQLSTEGAELNDAAMAVYRRITGSCDGADLQLEEIGCTADGSMPELLLENAVPGEIIYIRVWREGGADGTFNLCAGNTGEPEGDCSYQFTLNDTGGDGWQGSYITVCIDGDCAVYTVLGGSTTVSIGANVGQTLMVSYTAVGGQQFQNSFTITQFGVPQYVSGFSPSQGLVYAAGVNCDPPPPSPADCIDGTFLCSSQGTFSFQPFSFQQTSDLNDQNRGCLGEENRGHWFFFHTGWNTPGGSSLAFTFNTGGGNVDFAIWGPYYPAGFGPPDALVWQGEENTCVPAGEPIRCSSAITDGVTGMQYAAELPPSEGAEGTGFVRPLSTEPNQVYIMYVDVPEEIPGPISIGFPLAPAEFQPMGQIDCDDLPTSIEDRSTNELLIFPNPNNGDLTIRSAEPFHGEMRLIDLGGRIVQSENIALPAGSDREVSIGSSIADGVYELQLIGTDRTRSEKILIQR